MQHHKWTELPPDVAWFQGQHGLQRFLSHCRHSLWSKKGCLMWTPCLSVCPCLWPSVSNLTMCQIFVKISSTTVLLYLRAQMNLYLYFPYFLTDLVEFGIGALHIIPLSRCEVCENEHSECHAFGRVVNEFLCPLFIFIIRCGWELVHEFCV
jgi:hypothetical protein